MNRNPFLVLRLPIQASPERIVERVEELHHEVSAVDFVAVQAAKTDLLTYAPARLRHELLEVPGTRYEDEEWDAFARRHGRRPVDPATLLRQSRPPTVADFDLAAITALLLAESLEPPDAGTVPPAAAETALEIRDVLFG